MFTKQRLVLRPRLRETKTVARYPPYAKSSTILFTRTVDVISRINGIGIDFFTTSMINLHVFPYARKTHCATHDGAKLTG